MREATQAKRSRKLCSMSNSGSVLQRNSDPKSPMVVGEVSGPKADATVEMVKMG